MSERLKRVREQLEKAAAAPTTGLNEQEKRTQALQFAGLGGALLPALEVAKSKIQGGRWIPKGMASKARFLGGAVAGGLFWGGALPAIQHQLAQSNMRKSRIRRAATQELKQLVPPGTATTSPSLGAQPDSASSAVAPSLKVAHAFVSELEKER